MVEENISPAALLALLRDANEAKEVLRLSFYRCRIDVMADSPELIDRLRGYYEAYLCGEGEPDIRVSAFQSPPRSLPLALRDNPPGPGKSRVKEEFLDLKGGRVVRKKHTGMVFVFGGEINAALGPCLQNDNQVINFINSRYMQWMLDRGYMLFHAAGVAFGDVGIGLAGPAGSGKSSLALHLMERGALFVSNDRLMVRPAGERLEMAGIPKMPRINPGTALGSPRLEGILTGEDREACRFLSREELWEYERKYDVMVAEIFGADRLAAAPVAMRALVVLNWNRTAEGPALLRRIDLRSRGDLFPRFMKEPGIFYLQREGSESVRHDRDAYIACLGSCPVYELHGAVAFQQAACLCEGLLAGERL